jgi:putative aldouronate transport system permease protein
VASTFDTFIYQALQSQTSIGQTAAAGFFQAACCCVAILLTNYIVSKLDSDSAII